ncbi:MAG: class I SAM-dependent methyltransferase [Candidatus Bathyarchaeia archaeon]
MTEAWAKKREIREISDSTAGLYDEMHAEEQNAKYSEAVKYLNFAGVRTILDAGCGTGLFVEYLGDIGLEIFGVDISIERLKIAHAKFHDRNKVFFVCGDTDYMPFSDGTLDMGVAFTLIDSLPEPSNTLKEFTRVLRRGAQLVVSSLRSTNSPSILEILLRSSNLKLVKLIDREELKDFIAVCKS